MMYEQLFMYQERGAWIFLHGCVFRRVRKAYTIMILPDISRKFLQSYRENHGYDVNAFFAPEDAFHRKFRSWLKDFADISGKIVTVYVFRVPPSTDSCTKYSGLSCLIGQKRLCQLRDEMFSLMYNDEIRDCRLCKLMNLRLFPFNKIFPYALSMYHHRMLFKICSGCHKLRHRSVF